MIDPVYECSTLFPAMTVEVAIFKATEELGEVADAYIGMTGSNPRKGVYKSVDDLREELLDVALTALNGWVKTRPPEGEETPLMALAFHARERANRHRAEVRSEA